MWQSFLSTVASWTELYIKAFLSSPDTLTGWSLEDRDPEVIEKLLPFYDWLYRYYFRVQTDGWENIPTDKQVLLIGSHNGGLAAPDMLMMAYDWFRRFGTERSIYALMDSRIWQFLPGFARLATQVGAIQAHPRTAIAPIKSGASLLIYPGGLKDVFRPHHLRKMICFANNQGFIKLALEYELLIVPFISRGAHSTLFVMTDVYHQVQQLHKFGLPWLGGIDPSIFPLYLGLPWGIGVGPVPNIPFPVQIQTRVCSPILFESYGESAAHDHHYVNQCYKRVCELMQKELNQLFEEEKQLCKDNK